MANELDVGSIVLRLRADAAGIQAGLDQLEAGINDARTTTQRGGAQIESAAKGMAQSVQASAAAQGAAYATIAAAATKFFQVILNSIDTGVQASERYKASMIGLKSVASGTGAGFQPAVKAADELTDAFFNSAAAATSLKNLLSRGYTMEQAINTIKRLKDAAAFGRQGSLSLAEAVQSATEGLKNENSILVDNAGVTKNVSVMHKEYAAAIGTTVDKLTQAQKVEAEYQGILRETQHQVGDLVKASDTLSGKQAEAAQSGLLLSQAFGQSMTPAVSALTGAYGELLQGLTGIVKEAPAVVAGVTSTGIAITGLLVVSKAAQALKAFNLALTQAAGGAKLFGVAMSTAMPWLALAAGAVGVLTAAYTAYANEQDRAKQAAEEAAQVEHERAKKAQEEAQSIKTLLDRYETLRGKKRLNTAETQELADIQQKLQGKLSETGKSLDSLAGSYEGTAEAARKLYMEQMKAVAKDKGKEVEKAEQAFLDTKIEKMKTLSTLTDRMQEGDKKAAAEVRKMAKELDLKKIVGFDDDLAFASSIKQAIQKGLQDAANIDEHKNAWNDIVAKRMEEVAATVESKGKIVHDRVKSALDFVFKAQGNAAYSEGNFDADAIVDGYAAALENADIGTAVTAMEKLNQRIASGARIQDSELAAIQQSYDTIESYAIELIRNTDGDFSKLGSIIHSIAPAFDAVFNSLNASDEAASALQKWVDGMRVSELLNDEPQKAKEIADKIKTDHKAMIDSMVSAGEELKKEGGTIAALDVMKQGFTDASAVTKEQMDAAKAALQDYGVAVPASLDECNTAIQNHKDIQAKAFADFHNTMEQTDAALELYRQSLAQLVSEGSADTAQADFFRGIIALLEEGKRKADSLKASTANIPIALSGSAKVQKELDDAVKEAGRLGEQLKKAEKAYGTAKELNKIAEAAKKGRASTEDWNEAQKQFAETYGFTAENAVQMADVTAGQMQTLQQQAEGVRSGLETIISTINNIISAAAANPSMNINTGPAVRALQGLIGILNPILKLFGLGTLGFGGGGGGGGRGGGGGGGEKKSALRIEMEALAHDVHMGRVGLEEELRRLNEISWLAEGEDEEREIAEAIHDKREEIRKAALEGDYRNLDHRKALGQLTTRQEIAVLEEIAAKHRLTNDERMDLDEKLYEARKRLQDETLSWEVTLLDHRIAMEKVTAEQEVAILKNILDGFQMDTEKKMELEERLFAKRKELRERNLTGEKDTIQKAYNAVVDALKKRYNAEKDAAMQRLDAKIAALDEETNAENEAQRQKDYALKLADKRRELSVQKSARRRRELAAEIEKMEADEELRRKQAARQDEKSLLQQQKKALQDKYAQLSDEENVRQEALRMVMNNNLHEMATLIESYGDTWKDAGMQLAESLTNGLLSGKDRIVETINRLNTTINDAVLGQMRNAAIPNVSGGHGVVVQINGLTVREEADIDKIADAIYRKSK